MLSFEPKRIPKADMIFHSLYSFGREYSGIYHMHPYAIGIIGIYVVMPGSDPLQREEPVGRKWPRDVLVVTWRDVKRFAPFEDLR